MSRHFRSCAGRVLSHGAAAVALALVAVAVTLPATPLQPRLHAAASAGCEGGGFRIVLANGTTLSGEVDSSVAAAILGRGEGVHLDAVPENRPGITQDRGARRNATAERAEGQGKPEKRRHPEPDLREFIEQDQRSGRHLGSATSLVDVW